MLCSTRQLLAFPSIVGFAAPAAFYASLLVVFLRTAICPRLFTWFIVSSSVGSFLFSAMCRIISERRLGSRMMFSSRSSYFQFRPLRCSSCTLSFRSKYTCPSMRIAARDALSTPQSARKRHTGTAELDVGAAFELLVLVEIHRDVVHVAERLEELRVSPEESERERTSMRLGRVSCGWRLQTRIVDGWIFGGARSFIADQFFSASLRFTFIGKPLQLHALCFVHIFWPFSMSALAASSCVAISMYPMPFERFEYRSRMSLIDLTWEVDARYEKNTVPACSK